MSDDTRVTCISCDNRQRVHTGLMACTKPRRAGLMAWRGAPYAEIGRDFATLRQHCQAFVPKETTHASPRG